MSKEQKTETIVCVPVRKFNVNLDLPGATYPAWSVVRELAEKNDVPDDATISVSGGYFYSAVDPKMHISFSWERPANG